MTTVTEVASSRMKRNLTLTAIAIVAFVLTVVAVQVITSLAT